MHVQLQVFVFILNVVADKVAVNIGPVELALRAWFIFLFNEVGIIVIVFLFRFLLRENLRVDVGQCRCAHSAVVEHDGGLHFRKDVGKQFKAVCGSVGGERYLAGAYR